MYYLKINAEAVPAKFFCTCSVLYIYIYIYIYQEFHILNTGPQDRHGGLLVNMPQQMYYLGFEVLLFFFLPTYW